MKEIRVGHPAPLGASCDSDGANFALFSANASAVELCLFDDSGAGEIARSNSRSAPTMSGTAMCPA
jgi:pullulanase/glycogen debranching enzyme